MQLDMSKAKPTTVEEPQAPVVEAKDVKFNLTLSKEELTIIKNALAESKNFKAFVESKRGEVENKLLLELENFN